MKVFNNVIQQNGSVISLSANVNLKVSEIYKAFSLYNEFYLDNCEITVENKTPTYLQTYIIVRSSPVVTCTVKYKNETNTINVQGTAVIKISENPGGVTVTYESIQ